MRYQKIECTVAKEEKVLVRLDILKFNLSIYLFIHIYVSIWESVTCMQIPIKTKEGVGCPGAGMVVVAWT